MMYCGNLKTTSLDLNSKKVMTIFHQNTLYDSIFFKLSFNYKAYVTLPLWLEINLKVMADTVTENQIFQCMYLYSPWTSRSDMGDVFFNDLTTVRISL